VLISAQRSIKVEYVGQAFGREGERDAIDRLRNHESLQRIYADTFRMDPHLDVWLVLASIRDLFALTSLSPAAGPATDDAANAGKFHEVHTNPPNREQHVNFTEASLIKYFEPFYNTNFKTSFPSESHSSYSRCYDLDIGGLVVEVESSHIRTRFWSDRAAPRFTHIGTFDLHDPVKRRSMFEDWMLRTNDARPTL
jgi:hypothetical protein